MGKDGRLEVKEVPAIGRAKALQKLREALRVRVRVRVIRLGEDVISLRRGLGSGTSKICLAQSPIPGTCR